MLRKNAWIVALFAALAIVLMGCPPGGNEEEIEGNYETIFTLSEDVFVGLDTNALPALDTEANKKIFLNDFGFNLAGNPPMQFVTDDDEVVGIQINTDTAGWGAGIDLVHADFEFQRGDRITVNGYAVSGLTGSAFVFVSTTAGQEAGETKRTGIANGADFEIKITLSTLNASQIKNGDPPALRIGAKPANAVFVITEVIVERLEDDGEEDDPVAEDFIVDLSSLTVKNGTAWAANYQGFVISLTFPGDFDVTDYMFVSVKGKFFDEDDDEIAANWGLGMVKFLSSAGGSWEGANVIQSADNLGVGGISTTGAGVTMTTNPGALLVQNASETVAFIEITEIKFFN